MNLTKLFEMQRELDERIVKEKGLEGQDLLPQKILALQVELGECAQEWRGFKFWSQDQESRTKSTRPCRRCNGHGFVSKAWVNDTTHGITSERCTACKGNGGEIYNPLLEEYIDCIHFILSIGFHDYKDDYHGSVSPIYYDKNKEIKSIRYGSFIKQFNYLFQEIGRLFDAIADNEITVPSDAEEAYENTLRMIIGLGEMLGFTWDQIEEAYMSKNSENHRRQDNGY